MNDFDRDAEIIEALLTRHMLRRPEDFPQDERVARSAAVDAAQRQNSVQRHQTAIGARNIAARVRRGLIAANLERAFPLLDMVTRTAGVRGRLAAVTRLASEARTAPLVETEVAAGQGADLLEEVVDTWVELPARTPRGEYIAVPVIGDSMEPFLVAKDIVLVKLGSEVAKHTVIVARKDEGYVVKYVSDLTDREIELTSLGSDHPTIRIPRVERRIVGTVIARMRRCVSR